jgi:hypothetical protein
LLTAFFRGLRSGDIPRHSNAWKNRQLAENDNSL